MRDPVAPVVSAHLGPVDPVRVFPCEPLLCPDHPSATRKQPTGARRVQFRAVAREPRRCCARVMVIYMYIYIYIHIYI